MLKPDKDDPMKIRRCLAFFVSIYAFLVLPNLLVFYAAAFDVETGLLEALLTYVGVLATGPIGAYLYAAHKNGNKEK